MLRVFGKEKPRSRGRKSDLDVRGRNCDRPIERSTPLEAVDQVLRLLVTDTSKVESDVNAVEEVYILAYWRGGILSRFDGGLNRAQRHILLARKYLDQLDAASGNA
jgi:hypothetical protein